MAEGGDLQGTIERFLSAETAAPVRVREVSPLGGGACQDNYRVEAVFEGGPLAGDRRLVLRSDARRSLPGSIDRRVELAVITAAVQAGVKTPPARLLSRGLVREGAWAYFLDWAAGDAIGRKVLRDPRLEGARRGLVRELAAELARLHSVTPTSAPELAALLPPPPGDDPVEQALVTARLMMDGMREPSLALELAVDWLSRNRPPRQPLCLVHGDFRTGNFLVVPEGLSAVLDWEFAHWGAPEWDLAWLCMRNWRFGVTKKPAGGFASRAELYEAYEASTGRPVDAGRVRFWEVMGNVRWAAGCVAQGERYLSGDEDDLELIAIPRHAAEMELEALRLIEKGA
jgi:aminoglycoside phosphotransferase (APT) family kinase protein